MVLYKQLNIQIIIDVFVLWPEGFCIGFCFVEVTVYLKHSILLYNFENIRFTYYWKESTKSNNKNSLYVNKDYRIIT